MHNGLLGREQRGTLGFLLYGAIYHIGLFGIADVILNFYFVSLGYDALTISLLQSLPRVAGFITSVPVSLIANRIGSRRMIALSNYGVVFAMILPVFVPLLSVLALSRFLNGFFYGAQQITSAPLMMTLVDKDSRTRFFALNNVISLTAAAAGNFIGGRIPALIDPTNPQSTAAYSATLLIAAFVTLLCVIPFGWIHADAAPPVRVPTAPRTSDHRMWGFLTFLALPMLLFGFTGGLTFPFYNLFFRTQFRLPDDMVGTIISIGWLGMAVIPLLNPLWARYFGRARSLAITMTIAAFGFLALSFAPTLAFAVFAFTIGISFRNVMQPLYQPLVLDSLPRELHNNASAMSMVLWNIGWFTATALSGSLQMAVGYSAIMQIVSAGVLLTGLIVLVIFRKPRAISTAAVALD